MADQPIELTPETFRRLDVFPAIEGEVGAAFILTTDHLYEISLPWQTIQTAVAAKGSTFEAADELARAGDVVPHRIALAELRTLTRQPVSRKDQSDLRVVKIDYGSRLLGTKVFCEVPFVSAEDEEAFVTALRDASGKRFEQTITRTSLWDAISPVVITSIFVIPPVGAVILSALWGAPEDGGGRKSRAWIAIGQMIGPTGAIAVAALAGAGLLLWAVLAMSRRKEQINERVLDPRT